VRRNLPPM